MKRWGKMLQGKGVVDMLRGMGAVVAGIKAALNRNQLGKKKETLSRAKCS